MKCMMTVILSMLMVVPAGAQTIFSDVNRLQMPESDKTVNLRWQASAAVAGMGSLSAEWRTSDYFTFGPSVGYVNWTAGDVGMTGYSVGVQGTYAFDKVFRDSWYLSPRIAYSPIRASAKDGGREYTGDVAGATGSLIGGYQWFWSNFNMNLGVGAVVNSVARLNLTDSSGNRLEKAAQYYTGVAPLVDFEIGYAF